MIRKFTLIALLGTVVWLAISYRTVLKERFLEFIPPPSGESVIPADQPEEFQESFRCYFPATEGLEPAEEIRQRPPEADALERVRGMMEELHRGPESPGALSLFPPGTKLRSLFLASDGTVYLDYPSRALNLTPGPREEFLFMRCLARTLLRNCPEVKAFVIMVDGNVRHRLLLHFPAHGKYLLPRS